MNDKAFATLGQRFAALEFDRRNKGRPHRTTEAHLRENELAALLALAVEEGYRRGLAEGKGEDHPQGVVTAHGRLVALKPSSAEGGRGSAPVNAPLDALRAAKVGDLVSTQFDTGGGKSGGHQTLYGFMERAGSKTVTIRWESGLTNRVRRDGSRGVVPMRPDHVEDALATFARLGLKAPGQDPRP